MFFTGILKEMHILSVFASKHIMDREKFQKELEQAPHDATYRIMENTAN